MKPLLKYVVGLRHVFTRHRARYQSAGSCSTRVTRCSIPPYVASLLGSFAFTAVHKHYIDVEPIERNVNSLFFVFHVDPFHDASLWLLRFTPRLLVETSTWDYNMHIAESNVCPHHALALRCGTRGCGHGVWGNSKGAYVCKITACALPRRTMDTRHVSTLRDSGFHATLRVEPCLNNLKVFITSATPNRRTTLTIWKRGSSVT
jgi:hypothetical protein